ELALKNPPPLVPSSLMASWEATGPIGICTSLTVTFSVTGLPLASLIGLPFSSILGLSWLVDWISGTVLYSLKFWITPWETSRVAAMMEMGSRMYRVQRVMSTQKLPSIEVLR